MLAGSSQSGAQWGPGDHVHHVRELARSCTQPVLRDRALIDAKQSGLLMCYVDCHWQRPHTYSYGDKH